MLHKKRLLSILSIFTSLSLFADISLEQENLSIYDVNNNTAKISKGKLVVGQSGIINHIDKNNRSIILSNAQVIKTFDNYSLIKFSEFKDLKQDSIPNTKKQAKNSDTFILNFLYSSSLLITPNQESFVKVRRMYPEHNFVHSDILASYLKLEKAPYPEKEIIQKFAIRENIGTIFYVLNNKVYIFDAKTYKNILAKDIIYDKTSIELPFYTRVKNIETGNFDFSSSDFIGNNDSKELQYNKYYKDFLSIKDD